MTHLALDSSVPDWIIDHAETLAVFQELGIDYSSGGKSLAFRCREPGLDEQFVLSRLDEVIDGGSQQVSPSSPT